MNALGHSTQIANDGPSALTVVARFRPDAGLLDLGLPVMDGFELGQRLREDPALPGIVLIAITGYAQEIDRQRTTAAGFDVHLVKPVDVASAPTRIECRQCRNSSRHTRSPTSGSCQPSLLLRPTRYGSGLAALEGVPSMGSVNSTAVPVPTELPMLIRPP